MNLGDLYQFVTKAVEQDNVPLDTPVIYSGEYGYGDDLGSVTISKKCLIDEEVLERNKEVTRDKMQKALELNFKRKYNDDN